MAAPLTDEIIRLLKAWSAAMNRLWISSPPWCMNNCAALHRSACQVNGPAKPCKRLRW